MSKRMKICCVWIAIAITVIILSGLTCWGLFIFWLDNLDTSRMPEQDPPLEHYYELLHSLQETSAEVTVGDVFEFDFDEAYVEDGPYGDEASYLKELDVETSVPIVRWETEVHYRIFFIKDRCIIYDFVYDIRQIDTLQKGRIIYPDTVMTLTTERSPSGEAYLQIAFDNSHTDRLLDYTLWLGEICVDYVNHFDGAIDIPAQVGCFPVTQIGESAFYQNPCTSVTLPATLEVLGDCAFYRCHNIKEITLPAKTVSVGSNPFFRCSGLEAIHVEPGNPNYCDIDGVLYDAAGTTLIAYPEGRSETLFEIPQGVTGITEEAFGYSSGLQTVIIPESVTYFPEYNLFEIYDKISLVVVSGSAAEEYAIRYSIPFCHYSRTGLYGDAGENQG